MIIAKRKDNNLNWYFKWNDKYNGYIYETKENTYKIIISNDRIKPIWIGKLIINKDDFAWVTCERNLKVESLIFNHGVYTFKRRI